MKPKVIILILFVLLPRWLYAENDDFSKVSRIIQSFKAENFLGAANTSIPIAIPPGRRGIQPEININYSSVSENSWLGVGWSLNIGYMERSTKDGVPKYDNTDKILISFMGINSELVASSNNPDEYYPRTTSTFIKILFKGSHWEAYDKEGKKYYFGSTADAKIDTPKGTFRWLLNKISDTCGNYLTIIYYHDQGQTYPLRIEYTGNETTGDLPTHKVEFILEDRQDRISGLRSGAKIVTAKRLKEIKTYVNNNLANRYLFEYRYSSQTGRSLLTRFITFGSDSTSNLPALTFTYSQSGSQGYTIAYTEPLSGNKLWCIIKSWAMSGNTSGILYPKPQGANDFAGGGHLYWETQPSFWQSGDYWSIDAKGSLSVNLPEKTAFRAWTYVYVEQAKTISIPFTGAGNFYFWLNADYSSPINPGQINLKEGANTIEITGYNTSGALAFNLNYALSDNVTRMHSHLFAVPQLSGDFNGDGLMDLATYYASTGQIKVALSNGNNFQPAEYWRINPEDGFPKYMTARELSLLLGNFNDDTLTDIRGINAATQCELITAGKNMFEDEGGGGPARFPSEGNPFAADFNGDGVTDVGLQAKVSNDILISLVRKRYASMTSPTTWLSSFAGKILVGDFNGDGLTDIASFDSGQRKISVALNKGDAFLPAEDWLINFNPPLAPIAVDCDGDGQADICYYDKNSGKIFVASSDGSKFLSPVEFISGFTINDPDTILQASDFNGDNACDFYIFNPFTRKTEIAYSPFEFRDLLVKTENGIGGELAIKYDTSGNYDNTIGPELKKINEYRYLSGNGLHFCVPVIKEITVSDGLGNSYSSVFFYKGGFYDRNDREFRGFGQVGIVDAQGNRRDIYFKQDDTFKGKPYREEYKDNQDNLYLKIENSWATELMCYGGGGTFVYLSTQEKFTYDGDATYKKSYSSFGYTYAYDGEYDPFQVGSDLKDIYEGGDATTTKYRYIKYAPVESNAEGILSRPVYTYVRTNGVLFKKWMYYDGNTDYNAVPTRGLLTREKICLATNDIGPDYRYDQDPLNLIVTNYAYDTYGNQISKTDSENHTTSTVFDPVYHIYPVEVKNALNQTQKSTYDPRTGKILTSTDANNLTATYVYDTLGRLIQVIGPNDTAQYPGIIYEYDFSFCPVKVTKRYKTANPSTYSVEHSFYDGLGRLIQGKIEAENDPQTGQARQIAKDTITYNYQGKVKEKFNPYFCLNSSNYSPANAAYPKTTFEYDCLGRATKIINPDLTFKTIQYSDWTQLKNDENNHQVRSTYDAFERLIKQEEFNVSDTYVTQYSYDLAEYDLDFSRYRKVFKITDSRNNITKISYDFADRKVKMSDPDMGTWVYTYDKAGNLKSQKDAKGQILGFEYDALNRIIAKQRLSSQGAVLFTAATYSYDSGTFGIGRLSRITYPCGSSEFFYDNLGREIKSIKVVDDASYTIEKTYDASGRITSIKYPGGEVVAYSYNPQGIEQITGQQNYVSNIDYSPAGQIEKIQYANGVSTQYAYDPATLRLAGIRTKNGALQNLSYYYDSAGNIANITDYLNGATQTFLYDSLNRLIQANGSYGIFSYQYDSIGNMIYKEGVNYTYPQSGVRPHAVLAGSDGFSAVYDANGNMYKRGKDWLTYDYDNRLVEYQEEPSVEPVTFEIRLHYGWNFISIPVIDYDTSISIVLSSIEGKYDQVSRYNPSSKKFEHYFAEGCKYNQFTRFETGKGYQIYINDPAGYTLRLRGWLPSENINIVLASGWQMIGPLIKRKAKVAQVLSSLARGVNYDRICRFDGASQAFIDLTDEDYLEPGESYFIRMRKKSTWVIVPPQPYRVQFVYDATGSRIKKVENGVTTVYIDNLYEVIPSTGSGQAGSLTTKHIYLYTGTVPVRVVSKAVKGTVPKVYYYHPDHLGSTNVITDAAGKQAQLSEYKPYGELSGGAAGPSNYLFTGKQLDLSGLYYFEARYYDPKVGRFITPDPVIINTYSPQNLNHYSYCKNNPLRYIDPTGNYELDINEIRPGDVGMQRVGTNLVSNFPSLVGQSYAHGFIVLEVTRNQSDVVKSIRIGEMQLEPQNQRVLTNTRFSYLFGIYNWDPWALGERIQDYDFFRVTNSSAESAFAVARAESPTAWDFSWDPKSLIIGPITKKDYSKPFDSRMLCTEYLNFLYNFKFNNPQNGITLPSDIYNYQMGIIRPYDFSLDFPKDNALDNLIPSFNWNN